MNVIEGTGEIVVEPDWDLLFSDALEVAATKEYWRIITGGAEGPAVERGGQRPSGRRLMIWRRATPAMCSAGRS